MSPFVVDVPRKCEFRFQFPFIEWAMQNNLSVLNFPLDYFRTCSHCLWGKIHVNLRRMCILLLFCVILFMSVRSTCFIVLFKSSVSIWIICLEFFFSIFEMEYWNLLLLLYCYFSCQFHQCLLYIFMFSDAWCIFIYNCQLFLVNWSIFYYLMFFFVYY